MNPFNIERVDYLCIYETIGDMYHGVYKRDARGRRIPKYVVYVRSGVVLKNVTETRSKTKAISICRKIQGYVDAIQSLDESV